jgi:hypothetical protein
MSQDHQNLQQFYAGELQPILQELEKRRVKTRDRALFSGFIVFIVITLLALAIGRALGGVAFFIIVIVGPITWWLINRGAINDYRSQFKQQVVGRLVNLYNPDLTYSPNEGITRSEFQASQIYRHRIDRYSKEDLLLGQLGATHFRFSEVHAEYKTTTTNSKGQTQTHWHTIFKGIFFIADFNKNFNGTTIVLPDTAERAWGGFGKMLQGWSAKLGAQPGQLVSLEDPEFEQLFAVYSTDQVEARYILSTSLMERLVIFRNRIGQPIALSFINSCVYIAMSTNKNYFEPPSLWFGSVLMQLAEIQTYLSDIQLAQGIIEDLNLNTRIWGKS